MPSPEVPLTHPDEVYSDIQGEIPPDHVPVRFSVKAEGLIRSVQDFKKELQRPDVREIVERLHGRDLAVAAKHQASEIIFDVAKHRRAIIATGIGVAGGMGAYHIFRRRRK